MNNRSDTTPGIKPLVAQGLASRGSAESAADRAKRESQAGIELVNRGDVAAGRARIAEALRLQPSVSEYHYLSGMCEWMLGRPENAGPFLKRAIELNPKFVMAHAWLGEWYLHHGMVELATEATGAAMALEPNNDAVCASRSWVLEAAGDLDGAWDLLRRLIARGFTTPAVARLYGRMSRYRGEQERALELVSGVLQRGGLGASDASGLHFIAADLLDGLKRYDEAFANAERGNAIRRPPFDVEGPARLFGRLRSYFTRERLRALPKATYRSERPVFIVGMPRSGTSLVEQILSAHPQIHGAGELDFMYRVCVGTMDMLRAGEEDYPQCLDGLSVDQANGMAQIYLEPLAAMSRDALRITDKMPLNFMHLGLISLLLPDARIIHCRRNPLDTCLSCYMTGFNAGNDFKYDLTHLGVFYREYEKLMEHWKQVLELPILEVDYEAMTSDPEKQTRQLVDFVGVPWDGNCLRFHESKQPMATASVQQVRRPIYGSSVQRWRKYEKHLGPLKDALGLQSLTAV